MSKEQDDENVFSSASSYLHESLRSNEVIVSLALSPNEETLLAGSNTNHLYEFAFSKIVIRSFREIFSNKFL